MAGLVLWAVWAVTRNVNYQLAELTQQRFKSNMQEIMSELETNRTLLSQMTVMDSQFRKLLKLKDRKKVFSEFTGMGGPTQEDTAHFSKLLQEKNDQLMDKINNNLKLTNQQAAQEEASFKEISVFLDKQHSILSATPSIWPVKGWITSGFGRRASPLTGEPGRHMGVDIANEVNTPIRVTADGIVTYAGWETGYGRMVAVEHGYGYSTRYGHCSRVDVKVGDEVKRGQIIAYIGSTGRSTGSHVHYEVRIHGMPVDPEKYLPKTE
jgi:murein DD-endopeptidase MepM/ murein hydrolase activator NlpD